MKKIGLYIINEDGTDFLLVRSEKSVYTPSSDTQLSKGQLQMKVSAISSLSYEFSKKTVSSVRKKSHYN